MKILKNRYDDLGNGVIQDRETGRVTHETKLVENSAEAEIKYIQERDRAIRAEDAK